jgi:hypothetical protein
MPKRDLARLSRSAAVPLFLSVALVLGVCCLFLWQTVWTGTRPAKAEPFYTELPGVDITVLPPEKGEALLKLLNRQRCPCDCMRTVASCRIHHGSCSMSLVEARQAVEEARKH